MKSALANIGEKELSAVALRLEQAGREKDINVILSETQGFIDKINMVVNEIKQKNENNEETEDTEEALIDLSNKLSIIKELCTEYDKKAVKTLLTELREKTWSSKIKIFLEKISEHLLHSEFDEISALIDQYKE